MAIRIVIIQGHPQGDGRRFCHALAQAYTEGARAAVHQVSLIDVAGLDFPLLRSKDEFEQGTPPQDIVAAQQAILRAHHILIVFPLWMATLPALLKGFLEQLLRPSFIADDAHAGPAGKRRLAGKSVRMVVTMGMPALMYRLFFGAHGVRSLRSALRFAGLGPVDTSLFGMVDGRSDRRRRKHLSAMRRLGSRGR